LSARKGVTIYDPYGVIKVMFLERLCGQLVYNLVFSHPSCVAVTYGKDTTSIAVSPELATL
jgi:hypothetical protein